MDLLTVVLVVFLIGIFPLGELIRLPIIPHIDMSFIDLGILLCIVSWLFTKKKTFKTHFLKPLIIFMSICILALILQIGNLKPLEMLAAFSYTVRFGMYAFLYIVLATASISIQRIKNALLLLILSFTITGYIQYIFYPDLRNLYYAGWDPHAYRLFGTLFDPNFAGALLALMVIFIIGLFLSKKIILKQALFFLCFIIPAVLLTYSRSSFMMLLVGVSCILVIKGYKKLIGGVFVASFVLLILLSLLSKSSEGTNLLRSTSSLARIDSSWQAWRLFEKSPILGVGFNAYRYAIHNMIHSYNNEWEISHAGAGADNSFLFVLATTGLVGFIAYLYLWYCIFQRSWRLRHEVYGGIVFSSGIALFIDSLFVNSLFYPFIMAWMWVMIGIMENNSLSAHS